jgi:SAM-dependent methyltransferase
VAWLVPPGAARVVDVGAGTGKLTGPLLALGLEVAAVEPDPGMLAVLRREHPAAVPYLAGADALPIPAAGVDAVLAAQAWHWFPHERAIAEVRRVLRPGGWLGVVWNGPDPREVWEYDLARLDPDTGGRDFVAEPADGSFEVDGLPADELEWAVFRWLREIDGESLRGRLNTHSAFAVMEPAARERLIDAMVAVVDAEADRQGTPTVMLRQSAHCARWRP